MRRNGQGCGQIGAVGAAGAFERGQQRIGHIVSTEGQALAAGLGVILGKPGASDGVFGIEDRQAGMLRIERLEFEDVFFGAAVRFEVPWRTRWLGVRLVMTAANGAF